jgi:DNA-binding response OmpR family regulator
VAIAQGRPVPSAERHPRTIAVLRRDGVAFQQNGIWKIPGELIRAEILSKSPVARESGAAPTALSNRSAAPNRLEAEGPAFAVLPDGQSPRSRGTLVFATGDGSQTLVLSGIQWALFQQLYTARGTVVGLEQLARSVEKTVPAVRSAIHRLKKSFSAAHHGELIRNVRGGGYEFRATDGSGDRGA